MADYTREPWNDPAKNAIAVRPSRMNGRPVQAVILVGPDGEPYKSSADGSLIVDIDNKGGTSSVTSVAAVTSSVQLLASEEDRVEAVIENDSTSDMYVKYGTGATNSSYTKKLLPGDTIIVELYTGEIHGVWDTAVGNARVTQVTP